MTLCQRPHRRMQDPEPLGPGSGIAVAKAPLEDREVAEPPFGVDRAPMALAWSQRTSISVSVVTAASKGGVTDALLTL
jgi:hypothetical protein